MREGKVCRICKHSKELTCTEDKYQIPDTPRDCWKFRHMSDTLNLGTRSKESIVNRIDGTLMCK